MSFAIVQFTVRISRYCEKVVSYTIVFYPSLNTNINHYKNNYYYYSYYGCYGLIKYTSDYSINVRIIHIILLNNIIPNSFIKVSLIEFQLYVDNFIAYY